jgi:hypothetical protein
MAGLDKIASDGAAHLAQPDKSDFHGPILQGVMLPCGLNLGESLANGKPPGARAIHLASTKELE